MQARPSTASGGRPQTAREAFTVRVRTDKATLRVQCESQHASIGALRAALATQTHIEPTLQRLTRERVHWFDDAGGATDDFPDAAATLHACGIHHGDMLFLVEARPAPAAVISTPAPQADAEDEETTAQIALVRGPSLAFRVWNLGDDADAPPAATSAQAAASSLLSSLRVQLRSQGQSDAVDAQMEELSQLIAKCGAGSSADMWSSAAPAATDATAAAPSPSDEPAADASVATSDAHVPRPPSGARPGSRDPSHESDAIEDGLVTARPQRRSRPSSAAKNTNADASAGVGADGADSSELSTQLQYWKDRYTRLRGKAEKMNAAGLSLRNQLDVQALTHEKQMLLLRARLERRDAKVAKLERTVHAWESKDLAQGGDGRVTVEDAQAEAREQLTSLAAAPALTQRGARQPPSAAHTESNADAFATPARRIRPDSAGRFRVSRPSSGAAEGPVAADPRLMQTHQPADSSAPAAAPLVRPASAGRSRRHSATVGTSHEPQQREESSSEEWSRASHLVSALPLHHAEAEAAALHASSSAALLHSSRGQVRAALDAAKQSRSGGAGGVRAAAVAALGSQPPYARER